MNHRFLEYFNNQGILKIYIPRLDNNFKFVSLILYTD